MNGIVASAVASFNNSALLVPGFFWAWVLMLPVFITVWKIAPEVLAMAFPNKKSRDYNFAFLTELLLIAWLVFNHGNWESIRDGAGFLPYLVAAILFLLCRDAMARLVEHNPKKPDFWRRIDRRTRKWLKLGTLLVSVYVVAASAAEGFNFAAMQIGAAMFGIASGYFGRKSALPISHTTMIMSMTAAALLMQPEYFRFGQLGRLSFVHLGVVAGIMTLGAAIFVLRNFSPKGFVKDNHYKYMKWFMRLCCLLALILFVMTESVPVLIGFMLGIMATVWLGVLHLPKGAEVFGFSNNLWALALGLFGMLTVMPVITILGILSWKNNNRKYFWQNFADVLK